MAPRLTTQPKANSILIFYGLKKEAADDSINRGLAAYILEALDAILIRTYLIKKKESKSISVLRAIKLANTLHGWRRFIDPYETLTLLEVYYRH